VTFNTEDGFTVSFAMRRETQNELGEALRTDYTTTIPRLVN
jgi:hypothetical protein